MSIMDLCLGEKYCAGNSRQTTDTLTYTDAESAGLRFELGSRFLDFVVEESKNKSYQTVKTYPTSSLRDPHNFVQYNIRILSFRLLMLQCKICSHPGLFLYY